MKRNIRNCIVLLALISSLLSCKEENDNKQVKGLTESVTSDLQIDHLNIWVKDPKTAKNKLTDIGFTSVPDSLSPIHKGQGTSGRYFHFLNNYLELIFVYNQNELEQNNAVNKDLDFTERANFDKNLASPFSIALKVKDYNTEKIPFEKVRYHQDWMDENASIFSAKNSKTNLKEPSIFVVYPEIESGRYESLTALEKFPSEDDSWKAYFKHPNGAQKITNITITSTDLDLNTETMKAINDIENVTVKNGKAHLMELYFDNNIQKKSFDLRPELPLIIHL
jgi:hypothetical protein